MPQSTRLPIEYIEIQFIHACNLACTGCATFSELKHSGYTSWPQIEAQIKPWLERLEPECVGVMGGEPFMNPHLEKIIVGLRKLLPNTQIRVPTNGLLLMKKYRIVKLLEEIGNSILKISYHIDDDLIHQAIKKIMHDFTFKPVTEYGINRWSTKNNFKFQINSPETFMKSFVNDYHNMKPHNNTPSDAFDICVAQRCPFLFQGKLYKCSTAGLTPWILKRFNTPNEKLWEPYVNTGLDVTCSDFELQKFLDNFGKPHAICRQCPSKFDQESLIDHRSSVTKKGR
jgi:organic radical activating enzyme